MRACTPVVSRRRSARSLALATLALAVAAPAASAVYKCAGPTSTPIYQEVPCPPGKELRNFETDPPNLSIVPGRASVPAPREAQPPARAAKEPTPAKEPRPSKADKRSSARGDPSERKHLRVGMTEAELIARLGRPDITAGRGRVRWTWLPVDGDPDTITTVTLANGSVVDVDRKVVKK